MKVYNTKENVLVAMIRDMDEICTVCPIHEHQGMRTEMDPLVTVNFHSELLGEYDDCVAMVTSVMTLSKTVIGKEMGTIPESDVVVITEQRTQFQDVCRKLSEIQFNEAMDPDWEEDDDDLSAVTTGLFELVPVYGAGGRATIDELMEFQKETSDKLLKHQSVF